jgi:hypothetical protein
MWLLDHNLENHEIWTTCANKMAGEVMSVNIYLAIDCQS